MITSFFNKSKPINYTVVFLLTVLAFVIGVVKYSELSLTTYTFLRLGFNFLLICFTLFTLNFIVKKNGLTENNSFPIFIYVLLLFSEPFVINNTFFLISNLLVLLQLRRLVSLRSGKNIIKKLFDSGVIIALATLLNPWCILFILLSYAALVYFNERKFSYWLLPIFGFLSIGIISYTISLCFNIELFKSYNYSLNFSAYNNLIVIGFITLVSVLGLWVTISFLRYIPLVKRSRRPSLVIVLMFFVLGILVAIPIYTKTGSEFIYLFSGFSIVAANYFQKLSDRWFKEALLLFWIVLICVSIVLV